jgi:uncharacterized protein (DUF58 family)
MLTRTGLAVAAGAIIIGSVGVRFGYIELIAAAACGLALLIVGWLSASRHARLTLRRDPLPHGAARGVPIASRVRTQLAGRSAISSMVLVDELDGRIVEVLVGPMAPGDEVVVAVELPPARRGLRQVGPIRLRRTDPFGLVCVERTQGDAQEMLIHPRVHHLSGVRGLGRFAEVELIRRRIAPDPLAGFQSMREYVPGDDTRTIHWPTTAKAGRMMVREFVDPRRPTFTIVLITNAGDYLNDGFEEAVDVAASLVSHVLANDVDVLLRTTDPHHAGPNKPLRSEREALDLLALVQPTDQLTTLPISRLLANARQRSSVIAVGGQNGTSLGDLVGPFGDVSSILLGSLPRSSSGRVVHVADAATFALRWNDGAS